MAADRHATFEIFWNTYPKRDGMIAGNKSDVGRAFEMHVPPMDDYGPLLFAVNNYARSEMALKERGKFVQGMGRWLEDWPQWVTQKPRPPRDDGHLFIPDEVQYNEMPLEDQQANWPQHFDESGQAKRAMDYWLDAKEWMLKCGGTTEFIEHMEVRYGAIQAYQDGQMDDPTFKATMLALGPWPDLKLLWEMVARGMSDRVKHHKKYAKKQEEK